MSVRTEGAAEAGVADRVAGGRRRFSAVLWAAVVTSGIWAALRLSGWEPLFQWGQLVAFTPYMAACSLVVPVVAVVRHRWWAGSAALLVAVVLVGAVVPRALPDRNPAATGPKVRVLAANLLVGSVPADAVVDLVRRERPDVLTLQEVTPEAVVALGEAGIGSLLPHQVRRPRAGVAGSAVYARYPLREQPMIDVCFGQARAAVQVPGAPPVEVVSVHPRAPTVPANDRCWKADLRALPRADAKGPVRILAGDFNATLDHADVRRLTGSGYRDAADVTGDGLRHTWPAALPGKVPLVAIDHVLADARVAVRAFDVHALPTTDHRPVMADLVLPRP